MDIQQQTKNVAAQGRFGDSMLLHVNPAEVKGLASAVPLTINPETGQPEAFLPFLAPILGSMGMTALAGTGFSPTAEGIGGVFDPSGTVSKFFNPYETHVVDLPVCLGILQMLNLCL